MLLKEKRARDQRRKPRTVKNVEEWRERAFQRLDQVLGKGARKAHHERVVEVGGLAVTKEPSDNAWVKLDPVAVANGIAAEVTGTAAFEETTPRAPLAPVPFEPDAAWIAAMERQRGCKVAIANEFIRTTAGVNNGSQ